METQKIVMSNGKFSGSHQMNKIRERLVAVYVSKWALLSTISSMKEKTCYYALLLFFFILASCAKRESIHQFAATETYPEDTILQNISSKRAMVVIAHDDDMCAMSGTMSQLNKKGWEIAVVSFSRSVAQNEAHKKACAHVLNTVHFVDLKPSQYRNDPDKGYHPIPKTAFDTVFNQSIIIEKYLDKIQSFNPTVIFTLDNEIGGYGHPDHVFISQMVIDLAKETLISPKYIYQSVLSSSTMDKLMVRRSKLMEGWGYPGDGWEKSKKTYGVNGMPEPTVQFNIESEAKAKMNYLRSYHKGEKKSINFFLPAFEKYDAEEYFEVFDREFFRIIKI